MIDHSSFPLLSFAIWFPILSGILLIFIDSKNNSFLGIHIKKISLILASFSFILTLLPVLFFNELQEGFQFIEKFIWFKNLNVYYFLGVDGISIFFLPLTSIPHIILLFFPLFIYFDNLLLIYALLFIAVSISRIFIRSTNIYKKYAKK